MEATYLRIGNYLHYKDKERILTVSNLGSFGFETVCNNIGIVYGSDDISEYNGIPLTEEWLLKLPKNIKFPEWIKSLHELQNWYYWNNNKKELPINL